MADLNGRLSGGLENRLGAEGDTGWGLKGQTVGVYYGG